MTRRPLISTLFPYTTLFRSHRAPAPGRVRVALFAREAPDRLAELGERRLGVALDRHGGGVVLAELPWVDVEMDDRDPRRHRVHVVGQRERKEAAAHRGERAVA